MYLTKTPKVIQNMFPGFTWKVNADEPVMYLTFDDGPVPEITDWVLNELKKHNAKASFFCVGLNVKKNPALFERIKNEGHAIGNHTYQHLNGWDTENIPYFHDVRHCANLVKSELFRPPYGKLKPKQVQFLQRHYQIIMWDVLSGDFDQSLDKEKCFMNVVNGAGHGSIVVFHDSYKAEKNLKYTLPKVLKYFSKLGYRFENLNHAKVNQNIKQLAQNV